MRMEQYLTFTDHALWEVIVNGDSVTPIASASTCVEGPIPPKTTEQKLARKNELKAKSTLMLAIPDEHLLKFHACKDAKYLWEAIKNRFRGNKESKKMQKIILKQNSKNFTASSQEGLDKTYDRFQKLINNSSSTNETVNTAHSDSAASSKDKASTASYADDVMFSFFSNQSNALQLDYKDLEQINADDLKEMDLKWQVAMLTMRVKRFIKKTGRKMDLNDKETVGFDRTKVECYNCHRRGHFVRECRAPRNQGNRNRDALRRNAPVDTSTTNALVVQDGIGGYDWSFQAKEGITNFALMAYTSQGSSSSSSSDSKVHTCSKDCLKSYEALQKQYDQQREALNKSNLEIIGYQMGLESLEARIVVHEKNEADYEEDIAFLKYDVQVKDISIKELKNHQITAKDKTGLGFDEQVNESEVLDNVFDIRESDGDDNLVGVKGYHVVPPSYTGNYMPSRPDLSFAGLDDYVYKTKVSEIETSISKTSKDIVEEPKTVRLSAPIIEEWDTDSDNDGVFRPKSDQTKPKFTKINFVKSGENVKSINKENIHNFNHLIKDCDFHDNKMVEKPVLNNKGRVIGQREIRPVWNNAQRVNHQNKLTHPHPKRNFVPTAVATKSGQVPVNAAKQSSPRAATSISTARPVNTAAPKSKVNDALPITYSYFKAHSPSNPQYTLQDQGIFDSGCSRHMTINKSFLTYYQQIDGGFVAFAGSAKGDHKVKTIRCDNGTEFKNRIMNEFCEMKGIRREFSIARTPQQNGVAERKNRTLTEATRTMLANSKLPTTFWAEAVNTACYVQNRVLVIKPHNKNPYERFLGRKPALSFIRPFGCHVTILNTLDHLANIDEEQEEYRQFWSTICNPTHFDLLDSHPSKEIMKMNLVEMKLERSMGVLDPVKEDDKSGQWEATNTSNTNRLNTISSSINTISSSFTTIDPGREKAQSNELKSVFGQDKDANGNSIYRMFTLVNAAGSSCDNLGGSIHVNAATLPNADLPTDPLMLDLEDTANLLNTSIFSGAYDDEDVGTEADLNNLETTMNVSPIPTTRIHKDHPKEQIRGYPLSVPQTRRMTKSAQEHAMVYRNKKYERGIVVKNMARLVAQGYTQEEGIDYDEMDVKSAFLYGTIEEEVYVDDIIFGSTKKSLRTEFESLMHKKFQMSSMMEPTFFLGLQVMQRDDEIFISQDKYVADILKKFDFSSVKTTSTLIETNKALLKDEEAEDVDVHLYKSIIGSLMYLTASRPDIMFAVCACARFQVTPKVSHLHAMKRIFRYLKGQPKLGLWYPRDSPFYLEAFSDSDYAGASLDRKSTIGSCQFLGKRLISWQCNKQTIVANSTTEAEYVATANCCGHVLWIQNQMLDYGFNFMNTEIYIDNESNQLI
ncbi:putative ribonuclease H-like domain-containing protein [Tanacetum coccineum]